MTLENKIRAKAANKTRVLITMRKRARQGFKITAPDGTESFHPTKREAMQALFARIRCEPIRFWWLTAIVKGGK